LFISTSLFHGPGFAPGPISFSERKSYRREG
jgi:hypothetical protein